jgi:hypothetical protein
VVSNFGCPYCKVEGEPRRFLIRNLHDELVCRHCGYVERSEGECSCSGCEPRRESEYARLAATSPQWSELLFPKK